MPAWLLTLIMSLGLPTLKVVLKAVLKALEKKYPGLKPLVDAIIKYLDAGGSIDALKAHMEPFCQGAACSTQLKEN
jgi:hypothetical protein